MMRKIVSLLCATSLLFIGSSSEANLDAALHSMWAEASTSPSVINSQTRKGFSLGSFDARWPVKSYNLVQIDPPRIDAGCGGISLYGGAFSFIKLSEFKKMLRNIGSAAEGYFFKLALESVCHPCSATISWLQDAAQRLNNFNINSCKVGQSLAMGAGKALYDSGMLNDVVNEQAAKKLSVAQYSDITESMNFRSLYPDKAKEDATKNAQGNSDPTYGPNGNIVWRSLKSKKVSDLIGDISGTFGGTYDSEKVNYYLMSILGTEVFPAVNDPADGNCPANSNCSADNPGYKPALSLLQLVQGNPADSDGVKYWKCQKYGDDWDGCLKLEKVKLDFKGPEAYVNKLLFGSDLGSTAVAGSIVADIKTPSAALTTNLKKLASIVPAPILRYFVDIQNDEGAVSAVALQLKPYIVKVMEYRLATAIRGVVQGIYDGAKGPNADNPTKLPTFDARIESFDNDIRALFEAQAAEYRSLVNIQNFVTSVRKMNPSLFLSYKQ